MSKISNELSFTDLSGADQTALRRQLQEMATLGVGYDRIQSSLREVDKAAADLFKNWERLEKELGDIDFELCGQQGQKLRALDEALKELDFEGEFLLPARDTGQRGRRKETLRRTMVGIARGYDLSVTAIVELLKEVGIPKSEAAAIEEDIARNREKGWDLSRHKPGRPKRDS